MKRTFFVIALILPTLASLAQGFGIVRKNYFSSYFDSLSMSVIDVLDSSTIRLGSINALSGQVTNLGAAEYNMGINLTGATINPYAQHYLISSGGYLLTFDLVNGTLLDSVPINGPLSTFAFQNYRFNTSDTVIYGLVPQNFYSSYFDSLSMTTIDVLDSSHIRFASLNPQTGLYNLIGNTAYKNVYTLAGNSIDPHQMIYYYSAVDTLVGIDLYTGNVYAEVPIQLPPHSLFENFTYSCVDTSIYGLVRKNYVTSVYDSVLMMYIDEVDSVSVRLAKINPATGAVTYISPANIGLYATLNGSCFIDPNTMTYYFSTGNSIVGVSLSSGLITSTAPMTFQAGAMYFDMMRSKDNCLGALRVRQNAPTSVSNNQLEGTTQLKLFPNPTRDYVIIQTDEPLQYAEIRDIHGRMMKRTTEERLDVSGLASGMYFVNSYDLKGKLQTARFIKE